MLSINYWFCILFFFHSYNIFAYYRERTLNFYLSKNLCYLACYEVFWGNERNS